MSSLAGTGGPQDFNKRLQAALERARGAAKAKPPPAPPPPAGGPGAPGGPPTEDLFSSRLMMLREAQQAPPSPPPPPPVVQSGPVGAGDYVVKPGDCLSSIAYDHGFFWETLWNDAANAALREVRQDPYVLLPGDRVTIPEKRRKDEDLAPEQRHRFKRLGTPETLVMTFRTGGQPRANQPYELYLDDKLAKSDVTDPNGRVELPIPPDAKEGRIRFPQTGDEYVLDLGHLDPLTEVSGVQGRLRNLGLYEGPLDGQPSPELTAAVRSFQRSQQLEPDGQLNDETRAKLREVHGS